ncbi:MAG: DUF2062 domain-containing protein [Bacteroidota bacterium]
MISKIKNISPKKVFREIFMSNSDNPNKVATALALGVFIAIVPIYGFQSVVAIGLSHLFKLNKAIVFAATNISWPPIVFVLIYGSYQTGHFINFGKFDYLFEFSKTNLSNTDFLGEKLYLFVIGSVVFGILFALTTWMTTMIAFTSVKAVKSKSH